MATQAYASDSSELHQAASCCASLCLPRHAWRKLSEELYGLPPLLRFACHCIGFLSLFDPSESNITCHGGIETVGRDVGTSIICGYDVMMVDDGWMHGTSVADDYNTTTRKDLNNYYKLDCRVDGLE